jgi:RHS repeat-associated protein
MTAGPLPANVNANSTLIWDGENRLIQATVGTTGSVVRYSYDSQSRRIAETVGSTTKITVYDGWNPIAEYAIQNSTFTIQNSYLWGIDLSGTLQGAGGVGGLLAVTDSTGTYFPTYDGNGNVSEYLNSTGAIAAHYEYDPFGKTTVATGPKANDFAHRYSTKPLDLTTGLYYYGYRYYDPVTGRWPSRDPIEEEGGLNLYGFVYNDPHNWFDDLGHKPKKEQERERKERNETNEKNRESSRQKKVDNYNADITQKIIDAANRRHSAAEAVGGLVISGLSDAALVIAHGNGVKKCKELFAANKMYCSKCMVCEFFVNGMRPLQGLVEAPERWAMPFAKVICKDTNTLLDSWWSSYLIDIHIDKNGKSRGVNLGRKYFSISSADIESN